MLFLKGFPEKGLFGGYNLDSDSCPAFEERSIEQNPLRRKQGDLSPDSMLTWAYGLSNYSSIITSYITHYEIKPGPNS